MKPKLNILVTLLAAGFVGCTSMPRSPEASTTHPANAHAAEGAFPPPVPALMTGTDPMIANSDSEPAAEHQPDHGMRGMQPKAEEPK